MTTTLRVLWDERLMFKDRFQRIEERFRGALALRRFLWRWDRVYRWEVIFALISFVVLGVGNFWLTHEISACNRSNPPLLSWNCEIISHLPFSRSTSNWWSAFLLYMSLAMLIWYFGRLIYIGVKGVNYTSRDPSKKYEIRVSRSFLHGSERVPFGSLAVSDQEQSLGFVKAPEESFCQEVAFKSIRLDDYLTNVKNLSVQIAPDVTGKFVHVGYHHEQMQYLHTRVSDPTRTVNDPKFAILSPLTIPFRSIEIAKVGYFDSLLTNEAFRSQVISVPDDEEEYHEENQIDVVTDLTKHFPAEERTPGGWILRAHPIAGVSGHVGITTMALSQDGFPIFFRQKKNMLIGAREITASGSGSVDFDDIICCDSPNNFVEIIKYAMARELCQEGKIYEKKLTREKIRSIAKATHITGFFRWVDRSGKPEFVGCTRVPVPRHEIAADKVEVVDTEFSRFEIKQLADFEKVFKRHADSNMPMSLSCVIALRRLVEISGYRTSSEKSKRQIYLALTNHLGLSA